MAWLDDPHTAFVIYLHLDPEETQSDSAVSFKPAILDV